MEFDDLKTNLKTFFTDFVRFLYKWEPFFPKTQSVIFKKRGEIKAYFFDFQIQFTESKVYAILFGKFVT